MGVCGNVPVLCVQLSWILDEPSTGLDPLSSSRLDELILQLHNALGATIVVVTHELASVFTIAESALFLDVKTKHAISDGNPNDLVETLEIPSIVRKFLLRKPSA